MCTAAPQTSWPLCNLTLPLADRVQDLLSRMTLQEKILSFGSSNLPIASVGLNYYQWWTEGLHGVAYSPGVLFSKRGPVPNATSFPQIIGVAASFNLSLVHAMGSVVSTEARAMNNVQRAGLTLWTPNINIFRDPSWGRGQETPGEDPYLTSEYAVALVTGLQVLQTISQRVVV